MGQDARPVLAAEQWDSPVPAQLHVPGTAWAQQGHTPGAGTAMTAAKCGSSSAARALLALEGTW